MTVLWRGLKRLIEIQTLQAQLMIWDHQRRRFRRRRLARRVPCFWVLPRSDRSWFDLHYLDATIPEDYFLGHSRKQRFQKAFLS